MRNDGSAMPALMLALDLGTTTLAGRLLSRDGTLLAEGRLANPQAEFGSDVIRRMEAALSGEGEKLQSLLVKGVNDLVADLLGRARLERGNIVAAAAAANPAICHTLRRLDPTPLLFPPHRPLDPHGAILDSDDLGLDVPVPLYLFPLVSGYVGGDLVAFLYGQPQPSITTLYVDIGTNAEMALFAEGGWWSTSVAAGPAFEGGGIGCGMAARKGAIEGVSIEGEALRLRVIGGGPPRGLCGSGLAEAVAAGLEGGLIENNGRIRAPQEVPTSLARYLIAGNEENAFRLYRDARTELFLAQADVRAFQLAKGALRAGVDCLLTRAGLAANEVEAVVLTGAFGLTLAPAVLKRVALLPPGVVEKVLFVPGGALAGVGRCLLEPDGPAQVQSLADRLKPYPLSGTPAFEAAFLNGLDF